MTNLIIGLSLAVLVISCGNEEVSQDEKKQEQKSKKIQSEHTALSQSNLEEISIKIPTAVCGMCEKNIKKALTEVDGVIEVKVSAKKKTAEVEFDSRLTDPAALKTAISKAGYDADGTKRDGGAYEKLDDCCKADSHT